MDTPSAWVCRFTPLILKGTNVLDVASGRGRHARYLASLGYQVEAVDRDNAALDAMSGINGISTRLADLEGAPWPYTGQSFGGIVVTYYLHRPLFPHLLGSLAPQGVLIYETFARGNERYGRPQNPDFLLKPGELLDLAYNRLRIVAYEDLYVDTPKPAMMQRICAINDRTSL